MSRRSARAPKPPADARAEDEAQPSATGRATGVKAKTSVAPPATPPAKRGRAAAKSTAAAVPPAPPSASKKGLSGLAPPLAVAGVLVLDTGLTIHDAALASRASVFSPPSDGLARSARLALVEPLINSDKYYILQLLADPGPPTTGRAKSRKAAALSGGCFWLYSRWGRTGTSGSSSLDGPLDEARGEAAFAKLYSEKTGHPWGAPQPQQPGKYAHLAGAALGVASGSSLAMWQYELTDDPHGKPDGWYDYEPATCAQVNALFAEHAANPALAVRFVASEDSGYTYKTNTTSGTVRTIWRVAAGSAHASGAHATARKAPAAPKAHSSPAARAPPSGGIGGSGGGSGSGARPLDSPMHAALHGGVVYDDWDGALTQTELGKNANKFIRVQLVQLGGPSGPIYMHRRWGRVGEAGQLMKALEGPYDAERAIGEFQQYIKSKTGHKWEQRHGQPTAKPGKYAFLEMEEDEDVAAKQLAAATDAQVASPAGSATGARPVRTAPCSLEEPTQVLVELIFKQETLAGAMRELDVDTARLPLGALSRAQIARGEAALCALEDAIASTAGVAQLQALTSAFYTAIPHDCGRSKPPLLSSQEAIDRKWEMLGTLADIDAANRMAADAKQQAVNAAANAAANASAPPRAHPCDDCYRQLECTLTLLAPGAGGAGASELNCIETYVRATAERSSNGQLPKLLHAWRADRRGDDERFAAHGHLANRRLLWHGTNVAVVAAILKSGLRIMPHSGARVGRGIYLADCHAKSASYVRPAGQRAVMFLVEAALGKQHLVDSDGPHASGLIAPPTGFDSVLAQGRMQPDPAADESLQLGGHAVAVPQGVPVPTLASASAFEHNEFLLYDESQHRIRYVLLFEWD